MSAGPALTLAEAAPRLYRAVAAYSGCPGTTDPLGVGATVAVVSRGGGNVLNMWGAPGPAWVARDPVVNADRLRGKAVYLSAASGVPSIAVDRGIHAAVGGLAGGAELEAYALACTTNMANRLSALRIPHTFRAFPRGSHSWGLFASQLRDSWPVIGRAIGA